MTDAEIEAAAAHIAAVKRGDAPIGASDLDGLRTALASEFGRRHGWTHRRYDQVSAADLSGRWVQPDAGHLVSNAYVFRLSDGSPAAVVGHVYRGAPGEGRDDLARRGATLGLRVTFPGDFPSWWNPGQTTSVLFERSWARMPVLQPIEDEGDNWWSPPRQEPFSRDDVLFRVPWPSEVEAVAEVSLLIGKLKTHRHILTAMVERMYVLHQGHPSTAVRSAAFSALAQMGKLDVIEIDGGDA